jgi:hypothetical protein
MSALSDEMADLRRRLALGLGGRNERIVADYDALVAQRADLLAAYEALTLALETARGFEGSSDMASSAETKQMNEAEAIGRAAIAKARTAEPGTFRTSISETFNAGDE